MLTQCVSCDPADRDIETSVAKQLHNPIFFLSGKFQASQLNWHISQKELYPIIYVFKRLPYLVFGHTTRITVFTDHKNLEHILHPEWVSKSAYIDRLIRWGLLLQNVDLCVRHIAGEENVIADILSRWGNRFLPDKPTARAASIRVCALRYATIEEAFENEEISFKNPWYMGKWERITSDEILKEQQHALNNPKLAHIHKPDNKVWIPYTLLPRLVVHNHIAASHPSLTEELHYLKSFSFELPSPLKLEEIVRAYRKRCLHCQRRPQLLRRALNETPMTLIPRKILHADYLYLNKHSYYLVIVDNATRKVFLKHTVSADASTMALAIMEFLGNFQLLDTFTLYTDNGSHFSNELLEKVSAHLTFSRQFSVQYAPWTNGTVEVTNSKLLKIVKTICSEFRIFEKDLHTLTGLLMHVMNNSPSPIKANYTPNQLFMNAPENIPGGLIDSKTLIAVQDGEVKDPRNIDRVLKNIKELQTLMLARLNEAYTTTSLRRSRQNTLYNERHNTPVLQFQPGEWVLVSKFGTKAARDKTKPMWVGPYQIDHSAHRNVYVVRDLVGRSRLIHSSRIWPYAPATYTPPPNLVKLFTADVGSFQVSKILGLKQERGVYYLKIHWLGFDNTEDSWEPLENLALDVPTLVGDYLFSKHSALHRRAFAEFRRLTEQSPN